MAYSKKPMTENEKKAKLSVLKDAHKAASDVMTQSLTNRKDPKSLKDHVKDMSDEAEHDFEGDAEHIEDPKRMGTVLGRKVSFEKETHQADDQSVYDPHDIDSIDARIEELMKKKRGF